jgi:hypothetical protein
MVSQAARYAVLWRFTSSERCWTAEPGFLELQVAELPFVGEMGVKLDQTTADCGILVTGGNSLRL